MDNGRLNFVATIDDKDYMRKLENMQKGVNGLNFDKPVGQINRIKKEIEEVNSVLLQNRKALTDLNAKISNTAPGQLKNDLKLERNSLKKSIQEDEVALKNLNAELQRTKTSHTTLNAELLKTRQQMQALALAGKTNTAEYQQLSVKAKEYSSVLKQVNADTKAVSTELPKAESKFKSFGNALKTIGSYFGVFAVISTVIGLIRGAFNTIVEFDSKLLNVSKTTGLAGQELKDLGVSLRALSQELEVVSVSKLTEYASVAGQLGVKGSADILAFSKALAQLEVTSNISGAEGGSQIARLLTLVDGGVTNVKAFGDEITRLGNNFPATEAEILKNSLAVAQNTGIYKLARQEVLAYGTATKSIGIEAELTGASIGRTLAVLESSIRTGKNVSNVMAITGKSVADLRKEFASNPQAVLYSFIKGLNDIDKAGGSVNNSLKSIGITAVRDQRVLGSLATGGFDVLTRAIEDATNASGAMQQEFETASGKMQLAIEGIKVSWENFVLAINGSENVIGKVISGMADGLSSLINDITRATTSWKELNRIAGNKGAQEGYDLVINRDEGITQDSALRKTYEAEEALRGLNKLMQDLNKENENYNNTNPLNRPIGRTGVDIARDIEKVSKRIGDVTGRLKAYRELADKFNTKETTTTTKTAEELESDADRKKRENEAKRALKQTEAQYKKQVQFLDEISKAERELNNSVLGEREQVLAKINDKYDDMLKKAKELKANEEAINRINSLREKETAIATYRLDTTALTTSLEQQKKDYEDFENFKKQVGIEKAKEMYSGIIDVSKNYQQVLQDELNAYVNREDTLIPLTEAEKERVAALFKLLQDYSIQKQENDRKSLEDLLTMTQSYEQKILNLRAEYDAKRRKLTEDSTVTDLEARLAILDKEFRDKISGIIDDFSTTNNLGDIPTTILGATKSQIMAQIRSLEGYLNTAKNLTKDQVNSIKNIINELNNNLFNATDGQGITSLQGYYNEIKRIEDSLVILEARKQSALDLGGEDAAEKVALLNAQIDALKKRLGDLNNSKIIAIGSEFGRISGFLSETANKFNGVNSGIQKMLNAMAKAVGFASQMNDSFKSMSEHSNAVKDGTANVSTAMLAGMGYIGMFMSLVSVIDRMSQASERQAQRDAERMRLEAERYINQLEYERLLKQSEIDRARREQLGLSSRRKELSALVDMYELEISQIERLSNIIFNETSILFEEWQGGMQNAQLVKFNTSELQKEIDRVKKQLEELYKMDPEGYDEGGLRVRIRIGILQDYLKELEGAMIIGKSWQELQRDLDNGYIADNLKQYVQEYVNLMKAAEEAGYSIEDLQNTMRELATGTTVDELSNKLADAFAKGEDAVYSFAETMEEVLRNAIVTAFKNEYIVKEMDALFKLFGDMGMDGEYTQEELDKIREESRKAAERLQMQWDALYGSLDGFDFGGDFGAGTADGIKRITETQADRLTGILSGMQVDVIASRQILSDSRNLLSSSLDNLIAIEFNTRQTADNTYQLVQIMQNNQQQALGL